MKKIVVSISIMLCWVLLAYSQTSMPAPGSGGSFQPNTGGPGGGGSVVPPANWGSPWTRAWNFTPPPPTASDYLPEQGTTKVIACGYDAQGVWRVVPLYVSYVYDVAQYDVTVLNAWNPWTGQWDRGVDVQAYNTDYVLRDKTYDYYVVLSTGTFYFNL